MRSGQLLEKNAGHMRRSSNAGSPSGKLVWIRLDPSNQFFQISCRRSALRYGYTISLGPWNSHVVTGAIYSLQWDLLKDFEPVAVIADNPAVILVGSDRSGPRQTVIRR